MKNEKFDGFNSVFAERFRGLIEENKDTQSNISKNLLIARQTVSMYFNGDTIPTADKLYQIANYFKVSADYLLGLTDTPATDPAAESKFEKGVFDAAIRRHGELSQTDMMIEEMSELTKAILKFRRSASDETVDAILEEMADVEIMLDQMKMIFGSCAVHRRLKVRRLANRLGMKGEIEQ